MMRVHTSLLPALATLVLALSWASAAFALDLDDARREFPKNDFETHSVPLDEITSGGPPRDGIRSLDDPPFHPVADLEPFLSPTEPVIGLVIGEEARAYPLRYLMFHEIANDTLGGVPVAVTYCPLCNAAIVFERVLDGQTVEFGTTGRLRNSDLVMYDRLTETWWQQFTGEAIVGKLAGEVLKVLPARLESFEKFAARAPHGTVMTPEDFRRYGRNPYALYDNPDGRPYPMFFDGTMPDGVPYMMRVVVVSGEAWSLPLLREKGRIESGDLVLTWTEGQASALDKSNIPDGRDVGNVIAQRRASDGALEDLPYDVTFAFVFFAFEKDGVLHGIDGDFRWPQG
ncbi:MAG: DUF3179 domain-containing protein [Rhodospirillaceae bacterium]|jgi:hypothetical protein|nr:DUF3179 domain-containing protein [Rhodospirillaceae bacterium]